VRAAIPNLVEVDGKLGRIQRAILAQVFPQFHHGVPQLFLA
jgi:hypothetical protein